MKQDELEEPRDDLEFEIMNLDDIDGHMPSLAHLPQKPLLFLRGHRKLATFATASFIVLTILLLLVSTPGVPGLVARMLPQPAATPTRALYPGEDLFYVQANPSWGHLMVDGRVIAPLPVLSVTAPLRLAPGRHDLVWSAAPFQSQRCTLSVPVNYFTDTCADRSKVHVGSDIDSIIIFTESLSTLSTDDRVALIQAVQQELDARQSSVIVQKGEVYATLAPDSICRPALNETQCYAIAREPLYATLHFQLDTNPSSGETCLTPEPGCSYRSQNCFSFCAFAMNLPDAANVWNVLAPVLPLWTFQKQDGGIVEKDVPDNALWDISTGQRADESLIAMQITWQGGRWQVNIPATMNTTVPVGLNPVCEAAHNVVSIQYAPQDSFGEPLYLQWQYVSGLVPASGCLGVGVSRVDGGSLKSTINTPPGLAYCLLRFGVLLAVNDAAHHFWPDLPLADAFEQNLARQLAQGINSNA